MKRFIAHHELARDSRFVRQDNVAVTILSQLPDDVAKVVEVFEKLAPIIEISVKGTEAEPLYEAYGPAFGLITLNEPLQPNDPAGNTRLLMRMHGIFVGELQALEGAGRSLWDFPEAPWEFKMNMARQCWDERATCRSTRSFSSTAAASPACSRRARSCSSARAPTIRRCASRA
jgi:hypothetical protein